ncbi:MAG: hypothetical protein PHT78_00560 [Desulfitobacteriaceae bacterium]|nr:hypothetical protein [Desulfitobacteriaceae bacterium]MDD4751734.1 hypothetical protein [Desulfitobacteriaceae bacterium]
MQAVVLGRTRRTAKKYFFAFLAGVFLFFIIIFVRYPNLPKVVVYKVFREYMRVSINWKTYSWQEIENEKFIIKYHMSDADAARLVLETAEEVYRPVEKILQFDFHGKIPILIYSDTASLNRSFGWAADASAMGVYWTGIIRILSPNFWIHDDDKAATFKSDGPLAHEYAHFVVDYIAQGNYPRWLTEGIAQQVERSVTGYEMALNGKEEFYPLTEMDTRFDLLPNQSAAYRQSLSMIDYLTESFGEKAIPGILTELGRGATLKGAFERVIGISVEEFEREFKEKKMQGA